MYLPWGVLITVHTDSRGRDMYPMMGFTPTVDYRYDRLDDEL